MAAPAGTIARTGLGRGASRASLAVALALLLPAACRKGPPAPAGGGSIVIAVPFEVQTLDPHSQDKLSHAAVLTNLYEALVATDADMRVQPGLAESWESPDPLTWVFHVRPSVSFHGGRPLRAADVVYSFNRLLHSRDLEMRGYVLNVAEVSATGPLSVQIRTVRPSRILLNKLAHVAIVPEGATAEALRSSPDGTGPYALARWQPGERLLLRRNERYWGRAPALREVEFVLARPPEDAIEGLLAGRYGLIRCDSRKVESAVKSAGRFAVLRKDNISVKHVGMDVSRDPTPFCDLPRNPFKDRRVRQAIHAAIDRPRLVAGLASYASPASQLVPRFVFGFDPAISEPAHDPDRARSLLRQAGLERGFGVVLHARLVLSEAALLLKDDLGAIGMRAEVKVLPDGEFFALMAGRGQTLWLNRFGCATGDGSDILDAAIHSVDADRRFGINNFGGYANRSLDEAIERSAGIEKPDERRNAIQRIMAAIMEDLVLIPLYNDQDVYAIDRAFDWEPRSDSYIHAADIAPR